MPVIVCSFSKRVAFSRCVSLFLRRVSLFLSVALWSDRIMVFWQVGEFVGRRRTAALAEKLEKS